MEANIMGTLPIGRLLWKMSMPLIFSMLVQVLYGLVDSLYVAQLGDNALTAISLCMPVQYLVLGVGTGIGVGVNSVLSKKLGEKDQAGVNLTAGNGFLLLWVVMLLFAALGVTAMTPFYQAQTDIPEILEMCISYSEVLCVFSFAALHQIVTERLLSAIGRADLTMIPMLTGAIVNIILDPIMLFGWLGCPAMGIAGAGIATVTAQAVAALAGLGLNIRFNRNIHSSQLWSKRKAPCCGYPVDQPAGQSDNRTVQYAGVFAVSPPVARRVQHLRRDVADWYSGTSHDCGSIGADHQHADSFRLFAGAGPGNRQLYGGDFSSRLPAAERMAAVPDRQRHLGMLAFPIMEVLRFVIAAVMVSHTYQGKLAVLQPQAA